MTDRNGVSHTFSIFLYVLPYSKFKFLKLTLDQRQDTLFKCLFEAFKVTGGIPKEIWFDNMSTVVDHKLSDFHHHRFNERFLSFSHDAGFHPIACANQRLRRSVGKNDGTTEALRWRVLYH